MADPVHVAELMKGVDSWNAWRRENPNIRPDLSVANLVGANFSYAYRSGAGRKRQDIGRANPPSQSPAVDLERIPIAFEHSLHAGRSSGILVG